MILHSIISENDIFYTGYSVNMTENYTRDYAGVDRKSESNVVRCVTDPKIYLKVGDNPYYPMK